MHSIAEKTEQENSAFPDDASSMSCPHSGDQSQLGMANGHKQLRYLSNASQSHEQEPPIESGIPVIDFVNQLCYSMGLDAAIFTD